MPAGKAATATIAPDETLAPMAAQPHAGPV